MPRPNEPISIPAALEVFRRYRLTGKITIHFHRGYARLLDYQGHRYPVIPPEPIDNPEVTLVQQESTG